MPKEINIFPEFEQGYIEVGGKIPKFQYNKTLREELDKGNITKEESIDLLKCMLLIRNFEEMIYELRVNKGKYGPIRYLYIGASHLSIGQEAVPTGGISVITKDDYITSTHRGHGDALAKSYFGLKGMNEKELKDFILRNREVSDFLGFNWEDKSKEELFEFALQITLFRAIAELFGKEWGICRGRGGSMHIADFSLGHLGANAIVGGSMGIAVGSAMASRFLEDGRVTLCFIGDGAMNTGIAHEAINMACMAQFTNGLMGKKFGIPVIFMIMNNQYGESGQQRGEVTGIDYLAERGFAYNKKGMYAEVVNGMNVLAVRDAVKRAVERAREGEGPILLEFWGYRFMGHSLSDVLEKPEDATYRSYEELQLWKKYDPIDLYSQELINAGVLTKEEIEILKREFRLRNENITAKVIESPNPDPKDMTLYLFKENGINNDVPERFSRVQVIKEPSFKDRDPNIEITYREAIIEALYQEMKRDKRVILWGEDIADYGGSFGATKGLLEIFGRERIFNTPISEAAIVGTGIGAAMRGLRPVVEIMYIDFILIAMDQVANQAAKMRYMSGGQVEVPLTIITTIGGGKGYAGQHSQSIESILTHIPGLKIVAPSDAYDAKGLLIASIREDNPVIYIEHQNLLQDPLLSSFTKRKVPKEEYIVPIGKADIKRKAKNYEKSITVVSWSAMVYAVLKAGEELEKEGIELEVVDLRTLYPLDMDTILESVKKTGRLAVVTQGVSFMSLSSEIITQVVERGKDFLKDKPLRIGAPYCPPPASPILEKAFLPNDKKIVEEVRRLFLGGK
ncbi:MAG: dehydrogenase E1 component subunit alpha/beta [Dictyoglomus sp.]|nr:dehydrogenase E1 component subunit alpha/beta [Dictyoglomus sp.]MDW8188836.1 dehydrogenase E1 component subunit alpha/beta [Dictyoglomus sp.]